MRKLSILSVMFISLVSNAQAAISTAEVKSNLLNKYMVNYNDKKQMWMVDPGSFEAFVGASSQDIRSSCHFEVSK